jgi:hypothetical protein
MFCKAVHLQRFSQSMLPLYYRGIKSIRDSKKNAVRTSCVVVPRRLAVEGAEFIWRRCSRKDSYS